MAELFTASRQWASRPADERFWSVPDLRAHLTEVRARSAQRHVRLGDLDVAPAGDDLHLVGPNGNAVTMTNWGFSQLCTTIGAPANYISELPSKLACDCLRHGIESNGEQRAQVLLEASEDRSQVQLRALTSPQYSRIWDAEVCERIQPALDQGWVTPPALAIGDGPSKIATEEDLIDYGRKGGYGLRVGDRIGPAGVYRGDRSMFLFLVNPNRQTGDGDDDGGLCRGVFISNSEVGAASFRMCTFALEAVCGNHIVWGAQEVTTLKMVHRGRANRRFGRELAAWLATYADSSIAKEAEVIRAAKLFPLGRNRQEVIDNLFGRKSLQLAKRDICSAFDLAVQYEDTAYCAPTMAWGMVHGLTRLSQTKPTADARHAMDVAAGRILGLVS
jgi:hypothetical protein